MSHGQIHFFSSATVLRSAFALLVLVGAGGAALGHAGHGASPALNPTPEELAPGAVAGDELAKVLAWSDTFYRAHPPKSAKTVKEKPHAH